MAFRTKTKSHSHRKPGTSFEAGRLPKSRLMRDESEDRDPLYTSRQFDAEGFAFAIFSQLRGPRDTSLSVSPLKLWDLGVSSASNPSRRHLEV